MVKTAPQTYPPFSIKRLAIVENIPPEFADFKIFSSVETAAKVCKLSNSKSFLKTGHVLEQTPHSMQHSLSTEG